MMKIPKYFEVDVPLYTSEFPFVVGFFRHQCSTASYLLPLVMVPTSVMGIFTGIFLWVFVGFLWDKDIKDFMQFMAGLSVIVTFILEFVCKLNV